MLIMSFNIRTLTKDDGPNQWHFRRDSLAAMVISKRPDLIGFQEVQKPQLDDLVARVGGYAWSGVGREDGVDRGEFSPVFYRADRFERLDAGTFWLAADPTRPALGWDAACTRIATWVALRDRTSGREVLMLNTHLDHMGAAARLEGAKLIASRLAEQAGGRPSVLTGDFNCDPTCPPYAAVLAAGLRDARHAADRHYGPVETFPGWPSRTKPPILIDYIFVAPQVAVRRYEVLSEHWDGRQISDHRPVLAEIDLPA